MCGIGGVFDYGFRARPEITPELLTRMSDAMVHRGPDDAGYFISPNGVCGLTFRRLAIIDLSPAGHQPAGDRRVATLPAPPLAGNSRPLGT